MKSNSTIFISLIISFGFFAYGCNDDDDDNNSGPPPPQVQYPAQLSFEEIAHKEFRMWTAGAEVSTANLNPSDFINPDDYASMNEAFFMNHAGLTFTEDSVMSSELNQQGAMAYYFSNDSLFIVTNTSFGDILFGTGDLFELTHTQGYMSFCYEGWTFSSCTSESRNYGYDLESALDDSGELNSIEEISANDTLIVFNQKVIFSQ